MEYLSWGYRITDQENLVIFGVLAALLRVGLALGGWDLSRLPLSRALAHKFGPELPRRLHRWGLFFSVGYLILFTPELFQ